MKKMLVIALVLAVSVGIAGCEKKITVTTGEVVLCTAGEIIEDNTEQVEVPADEAADYSVITRVTTCGAHANSDILYREAQEAIAAGDMVVARQRLETIVGRDPSYRKAREQLDALDSGSTPVTDSSDSADAGTGSTGTGSDTGGTTTPDDGTSDEPVGPVVNLAMWVPDSIAGYIAQGIIADVGSLSRQYLPEARSADQMVIAVDQMTDAKTAEAEAKAITGYYSQSTGTREAGGHTVTVGVRDRFAAGAFSDGALLIVVEVHGTSGSGADRIADVLAVVEAISR